MHSDSKGSFFFFFFFFHVVVFHCLYYYQINRVVQAASELEKPFHIQFRKACSLWFKNQYMYNTIKISLSPCFKLLNLLLADVAAESRSHSQIVCLLFQITPAYKTRRKVLSDHLLHSPVQGSKTRDVITKIWLVSLCQISYLHWTTPHHIYDNGLE